MPQRSKSRFKEPKPLPTIVSKVKNLATPIQNVKDIDDIHVRCKGSKISLLGEASHGTSEFYTWRAEMSKRLIQEDGFSFIAVEGDWPDCYKINRYIKGYSEPGISARDVLGSFNRWPTWMWSNAEVLDLMEWLKDFNENKKPEDKVGFYGLDVYSLWESMAELDHLLAKHGNQESKSILEKAFECFEPYASEAQTYARATYFEGRSCEAVVRGLVESLQKGDQPHVPVERELQIKQSGEILKNAERYYRAMVRSDSSSWNIRDKHMAQTLRRLMDFYGPFCQGVVWEHNTHIGDARYTDMKEAGMYNLGQLVREEYGTHNVMLIGYSTYKGSVIAAEAWGSPMQKMPVPAARPGSWEDLLHIATEGENAALLFPEGMTDDDILEPRGHRAIGVVYHPEYDHMGNYVPTVLPKRYDALIYLDQTNALHPLSIADSKEYDVPQTYPSAL